MATNIGHYGAFAAHPAIPIGAAGSMDHGLTAILIAVGGTALIYILVSQIQNRRTRGRSGGSAGSDGGAYAGGGDSGSHFFNWGDSGYRSSDPPTGSDNSGDAGGGSDSGGGGGDGGGGGGD